ncbi:MAG TPA: isocitrate lyase/phosphoenolpyruvate mutase family protein [Miltoncostaea sp.]|nr:isocitrate lyase/phosphoenolpyruvate mutase family protein [Miltoncostaea sp.]
MTPSQHDRYERFVELHARPGGFVMPNAWDAVSALLLKEAGFEALGTSSAALAASLGRIDGRHAVSRDEHLAHAVLLGDITGLPINGDFEDGYGGTPEAVAATVEAAIGAGLAGIGIEDTSGDPDAPIRDFDDAVARVRAAAEVASGRIVLTGRTDNHVYACNDFDDTLRRLTAFAEVGADVLYAPFPATMADVHAIVRAVAPKPVNVVVGTAEGPVPVAELRAAGVARISLGAALYGRVMADLRTAAAQLADGDMSSAATGMGFRGIIGLIAAAREG